MFTAKQHQDNTKTCNGRSSRAYFSPGVVIQQKLSVNSPGDIYEQEADAMADKVMRMPITQTGDTFFKPAFPSIQRKHHTKGDLNDKLLHRKEIPAIQCKCAACEEEEKHLHRKENSGSETRGNNELESYVRTLDSSGQKLSQNSRQFFEPRFGHDFSSVRVHTDSVAAKSAQSINALAYTSGKNIVFNQGQYAPDSESGQKLMAHELTHVLQQTGSADSKIQKANGTSDGNLPAPMNDPQQLQSPQQNPGKVCGPKIDTSLKNVLNEVTRTFFSWDVLDQVHNCDSLTSFVRVASEWDIEQLHYENIKPSHQGCGIPENGENKNACSQTVEVNGKCYLAGTVNYVLWGLISRLCNTRFGYPSHDTMIRLLTLYNAVGFDDWDPPKAWAEVGWNGFTGAAPDNPNRSSCEAKCPKVYDWPFSWQWLPTHKGNI